MRALGVKVAGFGADVVGYHGLGFVEEGLRNRCDGEIYMDGGS
jgi:hypothetical protein